MDNLIERLRDRYSKHSQELRDEAADEIERLRAALETGAYRNDREIERLRKALEEIERTILGTPDQFREIAREALE